MNTLFLASASPDASVGFNQRMEALRSRLEEILPMADDPLSADLVVAVVDEFSLALVHLIRARCEACKPLRVYHRSDIPVSKTVTDSIANARAIGFGTVGLNIPSENIVMGYRTLPDPLGYREDSEILGNVASFVLRHRTKKEVVRDTC